MKRKKNINRDMYKKIKNGLNKPFFKIYILLNWSIDYIFTCQCFTHINICCIERINNGLCT